MKDLPWPWPGRYAIGGRVGVIGFTDLEVPIVMGQQAAGVVILTDDYGKVRHVFELYQAAGGRMEEVRRYVELREELGLFLSDGGTLPLAARVDLISEWTQDRAYVHVSVRDRRYWSRQPGGPR